MKVLKADMQKRRHTKKRFSAMHRGITGSSMAKCKKVNYCILIKNYVVCLDHML